MAVCWRMDHRSRCVTCSVADSLQEVHLMSELDLWLVPLLMALLVGVLCPMTGTLLVTQRRVLQANLISHAVLPGVAVAVAFGLDPSIGGVISGLLGSMAAERMQRGQPAGQEAVINTVLAGFLGLGVLLIPVFNIRLDLEALLFGDLLIVDWSDLYRVLVAAGAMALLLLTRYRHLVFLGVDPEGAQASGLSVRTLQLVQSLVTSMVIVSSMAAVGVILVIGLLCAPVLPGLWRVRSLRAAMVQSALVGLALSAVGFLLAVPLNLPPGPLIGVVCMVLLCIPRLRPANAA